MVSREREMKLVERPHQRERELYPPARLTGEGKQTVRNSRS